MRIETVLHNLKTTMIQLDAVSFQQHDNEAAMGTTNVPNLKSAITGLYKTGLFSEVKQLEKLC
jgi:hypothetical protein